MIKSRYFLRVSLFSVVFLLSIFLYFKNIRAAEQTSSEIYPSEISERLDKLDENQKAILTRLDALEETLLKEIRARCTR